MFEESVIFHKSSLQLAGQGHDNSKRTRQRKSSYIEYMSFISVQCLQKIHEGNIKVGAPRPSHDMEHLAAGDTKSIFGISQSKIGTK